MRPYIEDLARVADTYVSCTRMPAANPCRNRTTDARATSLLSVILRELFVIVGGCCGTTPEHIRAIADAVKNLPPRKVPREDAAELPVAA